MDKRDNKMDKRDNKMIDSTKIENDFLYLLDCAVNDICPKSDLVLEMDLFYVYQYALKHSLEALIFCAFEKMTQMPEDDVIAKWREKKMKAIRKSMLFDAERKKLFLYMEKNKIWYMPLKGVILKGLYKSSGLRQMADNDILFDKSYREKIKKYFVDNGYKVKDYCVSNHDIYIKKPVYNFEMHISLFGSGRMAEWQNYYENIETKLIQKSDGYERRFTDEDFYVYFVLHAYKHFFGTGNGVRSFVDCYIYNISKKLDWKYVDEELEKLGILEFEKIYRGIAFKLFDNKCEYKDLCDKDRFSKDELEMLNKSLHSGTYGSVETMVKNSLSKNVKNDNEKYSKKSKLEYLYHRLIPNIEYYKNAYPFLYKTKIFIPFFVVYRFLRSLVVSRRRVLKEVKSVIKARKNE